MRGLYIGDAEANGLLDEVDQLHVILFKEYKKDNWNIFLDPEREGYDQALKFIASKGKNFKIRKFEELNDWFKTEPGSIAIHNLFGYDLRLFKKMLGTQYDMFADEKCMGTLNGKQVNLFDTLSISRTLYPDRPLPKGCPEMVKNPVTNKMKPVGPHGLEAWGMRVANQKVAIEDWRGLPLWKYCDRIIEDVIINEMVWTALMEEQRCDGRLVDDKRFLFTEERDEDKMKMINWKDALRRGMLTDYLMVEQEIQGVSFDEEKALLLRDRIDTMMAEIEADVEPHLPKKEMSKSAQPNFPAKPFKDGTGEISNHGWNWLRKLGYPVNDEALELVEPPKTAFKNNGEISTAGKNYCIKHGVEDESAMADFIRSQLHKKNTLKPLSDEDMVKAIQDLHNKTMPDIMIPMKISNQDDVKKFLIRDAGWKPTIWRTKDATKDQFKKQRPDNEVDTLVREYIEKLDETEYRDLILEHLGITGRMWSDKEKMFKLLRRKARGLPTSPQLKDMSGLCPNLEKVDGHMAKQIVKWLSLRNRRSVLDPLKEDKVDTGWLNHPRLKVDGKLPARYSGITNTGRRKHTIVANVPKPDKKVLLGKEMRELYKASEGKYQVGIDGSNLEGMIAAWGAFRYDKGEYLRIMLTEDAHERNARAYSKAAGKEVSRGDGKPITYGIMYGAQAAKVASMLGISLERAQAVIDAFWDSNIGLKGRREALEKFWEQTGKRFIYGLDGRKIYTRSKHSLLNAYQQNGGAALFDLVGILLHWQLVKRGWYDEGVRRIIYYHDEYQLEVPEKFRKVWKFKKEEEAKAFVEQCLAKGMVMDGHCVKEGKFKCDPDEDGVYTIIHCPVGQMVVKCVEQATRMMKAPLKITGEYLTGANWGECH